MAQPLALFARARSDSAGLGSFCPTLTLTWLQNHNLRIDTRQRWHRASYMSFAYPDALSSIIGLDDGTVGSVADVSGVFADAAIAASDAALPPSLGAPLSAGALLSAGNLGVVEITVTAVGGAAGTGGSPEMLPGLGAAGLCCTLTTEVSESSWFTTEAVTVVWLPSDEVGAVPVVPE